MAGDATTSAWNGYLLTVACPCGVVFERWVTPGDAAVDFAPRCVAELSPTSWCAACCERPAWGTLRPCQVPIASNPSSASPTRLPPRRSMRSVPGWHASTSSKAGSGTVGRWRWSPAILRPSSQTGRADHVDHRVDSARPIAGFIGSKLVNKTGEGFFLDIALGIVGAAIGGWLFNLFGMQGSPG
jgi:hypothetical protein